MTKKRKIRIGDTVNVQGLIVDKSSEGIWYVYLKGEWGTAQSRLIMFNENNCERVVKGKNDD